MPPKTRRFTLTPAPQLNSSCPTSTHPIPCCPSPPHPPRPTPLRASSTQSPPPQSLSAFLLLHPSPCHRIATHHIPNQPHCIPLAGHQSSHPPPAFYNNLFPPHHTPPHPTPPHPNPILPHRPHHMYHQSLVPTTHTLPRLCCMTPLPLLPHLALHLSVPSAPQPLPQNLCTQQTHCLHM